MKNILIDMSISKEKLAELSAMQDVSVSIIDWNDAEPQYLDPDIVRDVNYLFCTFPCTNFEDMKSLEFIQVNSAGYSQLFGLGLPEKKITVANARGVLDTPVAEWCMAMMVNLARDLRGMIRNQEAGIFDNLCAEFQKEIRNSIVGIWGYGSIGREVARLCNALGLTVYAMGSNNPIGKQAPNIYRLEGTGDPEALIPAKKFNIGQEEEFLQELDFLVITMPLTNNTKGSIGEKELSYLKPTACLLNPARGPIIEEQALLSALRTRKIAAAALDAHFYYPMPADHPLWRFPNVIMTPHISGASFSPFFTERVWDIFVQNVKRKLSGQPLINELTESQLKGE